MTGESTAIAGISRRTAMRAAIGTAVVGAALAAQTRTAHAQTATDIEALNFMLNIEYLLMQFERTALGTTATIVLDRLSGNGVAGTPVIPGRSLTFADPALSSVASEIATDNYNHLLPIRTVIGALSIRQPLMDISVGPTAPFTIAMQRAGVVAAGVTFDPYANEENFLYGMLLLKNISVAAYRGLTSTISNRVVVQNFTGLLAAECINAATIRTYLYTRGATTPRLRDNADKIATYQRSLNGGQAFQGLSSASRSYAGGSAAVTVPNLSPTTNGEGLGRTPAQILNQLYLTSGATTSGGFFPEGVNGTIRTSATA